MWADELKVWVLNQCIALLLVTISLILRLSSEFFFPSSLNNGSLALRKQSCLLRWNPDLFKVGLLYFCRGCGWITLERVRCRRNLWHVALQITVDHGFIGMRELRLACFGFVFKGNYSFWSFWSLWECNGWLEEVCISSHVLQPNRSIPCLTCDQLVPVWCSMEVEKAVARHLVCNSVHVSHEGGWSLGSWVPGGKAAGSGAGNSRVTILSHGGFIPWQYTHLLFFLLLKLLIFLIGIIPLVALCISDQL